MPNPDGFKNLEQKDLAPVNPETADLTADIDTEGALAKAKAAVKNALEKGAQ